MTSRPRTWRRQRRNGLVAFGAVLGLLTLPAVPFGGAYAAPGRAGASARSALPVGAGESQQSSSDNEGAFSRRTMWAASSLFFFAPAAASARTRGLLETKQGMPEELKPEGANFDEAWQPIDVGESTLADPKDPKYQNMRLLADLEKQKKRNEDYDNMTPAEKAQKMCDLLGRGCNAIDQNLESERRAQMNSVPKDYVAPPRIFAPGLD
ncbi:unnamed protein product [Polarella glacialis]|uniref:Uncharacterized protein n=1 Tax=Polarella glacialis TaxID=89957 RepID=A0A813KS63_POLGL|nr:unnamed protein product [Polarella glacialis]